MSQRNRQKREVKVAHFRTNRSREWYMKVAIHRDEHFPAIARSISQWM